MEQRRFTPPVHTEVDLTEPRPGVERRGGRDRRRAGRDRRGVDLWLELGRPGFELRTGVERRSGPDRRAEQPAVAEPVPGPPADEIVTPWQLAETPPVTARALRGRQPSRPRSRA
jgi:hypothetical protein